MSCRCQNSQQDAQKGRPANVEPLSDARTPLADFFRILLEVKFRAEVVSHLGLDPSKRQLLSFSCAVGRDMLLRDELISRL